MISASRRRLLAPPSTRLPVEDPGGRREPHLGVRGDELRHHDAHIACGGHSGTPPRARRELVAGRPVTSDAGHARQNLRPSNVRPDVRRRSPRASDATSGGALTRHRERASRLPPRQTQVTRVRHSLLRLPEPPVRAGPRTSDPTSDAGRPRASDAAPDAGRERGDDLFPRWVTSDGRLKNRRGDRSEGAIVRAVRGSEGPLIGELDSNRGTSDFNHLRPRVNRVRPELLTARLRLAPFWSTRRSDRGESGRSIELPRDELRLCRRTAAALGSRALRAKTAPHRFAVRPRASSTARGPGSPTGEAGSDCWTRTSDPAVNSRLLYQLS